VQLARDKRRSTERPHDQNSLLATDSLHEGAIDETPLVELEVDRIGFAQSALLSWRLRGCACRRE
jgi:hypothetical protein